MDNRRYRGDPDPRRYREEPRRYRDDPPPRHYRDEPVQRRYRDEPDSRRYREDSDTRRYREEAEPRRRREEPPHRPPSRPSQKRRKKRSALSSSMLYILMVCGISVILAVVGWTLANDVLALNKEEGTAVINVQDENDFGSVVKQLKEQGIINYKWAFRLFSTVTNGQEKIAVGTYELNTDMDYRAILNNLGSSSSSRMSTAVTIPEGYSVKQIFQMLEDKGISSVAKLEDMAANHDYAFSFLQDIPLGDPNRLEGYLFPDTYEFYMGEDPRFILNKMLVNFDAKVTDEMRQKIADSGRSIRDVLIVASMIERETDGTDRTKIASVIYNRLNHPNSGTQGYVQVDATLQYVLDQQAEAGTEARKVTRDDYKTLSSPYNTYLNKGLPPGPIANPGMASIMAAMNPDNSNYYYYSLGDDGVHHFFNSLSEHENFMASQSGN